MSKRLVLSLAKRMPVKRVYTPELLLKMRREMEAGEDCRELDTERLVVTKVRTVYLLVLVRSCWLIILSVVCVQEDFAEALSNVSKSVGHDQLRRFEEWETAFGSK